MSKQKQEGDQSNEFLCNCAYRNVLDISLDHHIHTPNTKPIVEMSSVLPPFCIDELSALEGGDLQRFCVSWGFQ